MLLPTSRALGHTPFQGLDSYVWGNRPFTLAELKGTAEDVLEKFAALAYWAALMRTIESWSFSGEAVGGGCAGRQRLSKGPASGPGLWWTAADRPMRHPGLACGLGSCSRRVKWGCDGQV